MILKALKPMTERNALYMAGLFDGEGCVGIYERRPRLRDRVKSPVFTMSLTLANTNLEVLEYLKVNCGGRVSLRAWEGSHKADGTPKKPCYRWDASSREAAHILQQLLPYLIVKRDQAAVAMRYAELVGGKWSRPRAPGFPGAPIPFSESEISARRALASELKALKR